MKFRKLEKNEYISSKADAFRLRPMKNAIKIHFANFMGKDIDKEIIAKHDPFSSIEMLLPPEMVKELAFQLIAAGVEYQKKHGIDIGFTEFIEQLEAEEMCTEEDAGGKTDE